MTVNFQPRQRVRGTGALPKFGYVEQVHDNGWLSVTWDGWGRAVLAHPNEVEPVRAHRALVVGDRVTKAGYDDAGRVEDMQRQGAAFAIVFVAWDRTGSSWEYARNLTLETQP